MNQESNQHLYEALKQSLRHCRRGGRFLSVRCILERFGCNRRVLDSVLFRLESEGLITRVPRKGIFSSMKLAHPVWHVLLAMPNWPSELWRQWAQCACDYVQSHKEWSVQTSVLELHRSYLPQLRKQEADALVVFHASELLTLEEIECLKAIDCPVVMLNVNTSNLELSCVGSMDDLAGQQACQYLVGHGHRHLAVILSEPLVPSVECRVRNFKQMADFLGARVELIDCDISSGEYARQRAYQGVRDYLVRRHGAVGFTAAYVVSGESASGAMAAFRQGGYELPGDMSIIAHAGQHEGEYLEPPLTVVAIDLAEEVSRTFQGLCECLQQKRETFHAMVPTRIIERGSVMTLSSSRSRSCS